MSVSLSNCVVLANRGATTMALGCAESRITHRAGILGAATFHALLDVFVQISGKDPARGAKAW